MQWRRESRGGIHAVSRLAFSGNSEIVVHRHRDYEPDQWLYSCYHLGVERRQIGARGIDLDEAERLAVADLENALEEELAAIGRARRIR